MNILSLECVEIVQNDGWGLVVLSFYSNDPTIGAGGNLSFTITDITPFQIGKCYGLNLEEIPA